MARVANRQNIVKAAPKNKVWLVAFYIRLSREDKRGKDESESITNQRSESNRFIFFKSKLLLVFLI